MSTTLEPDAWPKDVREVLTRELGSQASNVSAAMEWVFGDGRLQPDVQRYLCFLKNMGEAFHVTAEMFDLWSPPGSKGSKQSLRLSNPEELLYIANHLYYLDAEGIPGVVLECGCAHGFSSACLSRACAWLGRELVIADSFEGLPDVHQDEPFFRKGDYASSEDEVLHHVRLCGRPDVVRTVKGWYRESLQDWQEPVAILWMDVDLYESARDLLEHVISRIDKRGAIFTHEFTNFDGDPESVEGHTVPAAIYEAFSREGLEYSAQKLCRYWGMIQGAKGVGSQSWMLLDRLWERLRQMDSRWREYEELRASNTVRWAFALKRAVWPKKRTE